MTLTSAQFSVLVEAMDWRRHSATGTGGANVDLTDQRFRIASGPADLVLVFLIMTLATAEMPKDIAALRAFALARQGEPKAAQLAMQLKTLEIEKLIFQIAKLRRMQIRRVLGTNHAPDRAG